MQKTIGIFYLIAKTQVMYLKFLVHNNKLTSPKANLKYHKPKAESTA